MAGQHEEEFVRQIKNLLSSNKKLNSAESATGPSAAAASSATAKVVIQEQAELKVTAPLEGKPLQSQVEPPPTTAGTSNGSSSSSAPVLPVVTPAITGTGLVVSTSAGGQQPPSQPSSPPSDSMKISFPEMAPKTTESVKSEVHSVKTVPTTAVERAQDSQPEPAGSTASNTVTAVSKGTGLTYSQAVINGTSKVTVPTSSEPVAGLTSAATCRITPSMPICPVVPIPSDHPSLSSSTESSEVYVAPSGGKRRRIFEVESVTEVDSPSPDHSEVSAHSSIENIYQESKAIEADVTQTVTESDVGKNVSNPLGSKSDSYISVLNRGSVSSGRMAEFSVGSSSTTPEPSLPTTNTSVVYQQLGQLNHHQVPVPGVPAGDALQGPLPPSAHQYAQQCSDPTMKNRSLSFGYGPSWNPYDYHHYHTTSQIQYLSGDRHPIAGDTFHPPPVLRSNQTYHGEHYPPQARSFPVEQPHIHLHTQPMKEVDGSHEGVLVPNIPAYRRQENLPTAATRTQQTSVPSEKQVKPPPSRTLTINDLPQAELLSQAFMQFMYSMSTVFRDPTYQPLIDSLERRFSPKLSSQVVGDHEAEPHSAPPTVPVKPVEAEEEAGVTRCNTHPTAMKHSEKDDSVLNDIMSK